MNSASHMGALDFLALPGLAIVASWGVNEQKEDVSLPLFLPDILPFKWIFLFFFFFFKALDLQLAIKKFQN